MGRRLRRPLTALALLSLIGCDRAPGSHGAILRGGGPDPLLVRLPTEGGPVRVYRADADSLLWRSRAEAPARLDLLGFDESGGLLFARDTLGRPLSIDLRLGGVTTLDTARFVGTVRQEGSALFGVTGEGRVRRVTPVGPWTWWPSEPARQLVPLPDGALLVLSEIPGGMAIRRLIPPAQTVTDSIELPPIRALLRTAAGDRLWLLTADAAVALRTRDLTSALTIPLGDSVTALAATPSGDRLFLASDRDALRVIDRFAEREVGRIELPAPATALRMDPDGVYLLARTEAPAAIQVIAIGTMRVVGSIPGAWREDLPLVTPVGHLILARQDDLVIVDIVSGRERRILRDAAADRWHLIRWDGFRPRAAGLDAPVRFDAPDSLLPPADAMAADSALPAAGGETPPRDSATTPPVEPASPRSAWTLAFATMVDREKAQAMAKRIVIDGRGARIEEVNVGGTTAWRVVAGPFPTRAAAERAGMQSGERDYWVFQGSP